MIGYKLSDNGKCRTLTYEVGKTYIYKGKIQPCESGFHFCKTPDECLYYYNVNKNSILLKIQHVGTELIEDTDKLVSNGIKILEAIPFSKFNEYFINNNNNKFNEHGNLIYSKDFNGYEQHWTYDDKGNQTSYKNSNGTEQHWTYDDKGNQTSYKDSNGYEAHYTYDDKGNQTSYKDSNGYEKHYTYDDKGNLISYEKHYTYDDKGNLISYKDFNTKVEWSIEIQ